MCKCKAFIIAKEHYLFPGVHRTATTDFECLMCHSTKRKFSIHGGDDDVRNDCIGMAVECLNCHSFVRYLDGPDHMKDEFYFFLVIA